MFGGGEDKLLAQISQTFNTLIYGENIESNPNLQNEENTKNLAPNQNNNEKINIPNENPNQEKAQENSPEKIPENKTENSDKKSEEKPVEKISEKILDNVQKSNNETQSENNTNSPEKLNNQTENITKKSSENILENNTIYAQEKQEIPHENVKENNSQNKTTNTTSKNNEKLPSEDLQNKNVEVQNFENIDNMPNPIDITPFDEVNINSEIPNENMHPEITINEKELENLNKEPIEFDEKQNQIIQENIDKEIEALLKGQNYQATESTENLRDMDLDNDNSSPSMGRKILILLGLIAFAALIYLVGKAITGLGDDKNNRNAAVPVEETEMKTLVKMEYSNA